jgi:hypothetical protein
MPGGMLAVSANGGSRGTGIVYPGAGVVLVSPHALS